MTPSTVDQGARIEEFQRKHRAGLLTLLFTDMVGSGRIKQVLGDSKGVALIQQHHAIVREILSGIPEAQEMDTAGDSFFLVFAKPSDAVRFALLLQSRLRAWSQESSHPVQDRIGIHIGEVIIEQAEETSKPKRLFGAQVDTCARVMSLGQADQILLTRAAFDNARQALKGEDIEELNQLNQLQGGSQLQWLNHGPYLLKGIEESVEVCEVGETGIAPLKAPPGSEKAQRQVSPDTEPVLGWRPALGQVVPNTKWVLEQKLGEGGFGEVWLGRHQTMKERRVFKFCFRADRVRSLKREMTLFRLLKERIGDHPNIVRLLEVYFDEPPFYVVMDYVEGQDLKAWCEQQGGVENVPLAVRLEIVAQIADALQAAHDAGVIHRDVKPGNILVAGDRQEAIGDRRRPPDKAPPSDPIAYRLSPIALAAKLTDFGIGQVVSEEVLKGMTKAGFTQTLVADSSSSQTGSQMYMAPELLAGKPASTRSDIYSLGVVLYQLLVSDLSRPLTTDWADEIADPLLRDDLKHCFAGNPQDRFAGAGQLAKNLRALSERRAALERQQAELAALERAAYRRGIVRTASFAVLIVAGVTLLALYAFKQAGRADAQARKASESEQHARRLLYAADMNLAQQALKLNNLGRARRLLDRHRPEFGVPASAGSGTNRSLAGPDRLKAGLQTDLCGWEWRYLWQLTRSSALVTLTNRPTRGIDVSFSPDGSRLAAGWMDGRVELWDVPGRRWVRALTDREYRHRGRVAFSPVRNLLAATSEPKVVALYDLDSGRESILWRAPDQGEWEVRDLAFSQDGSRLVIYAGIPSAKIYGGSTLELGDEVWVVNVSSSQIERRHQTLYSATRFHGAARLSPDNRRLYLARSDALNYRYSIQCLDLATGKELWQTEPQRDYGLTALAISPDGRVLASGSGYEDPTIRVWEAATGRLLVRLEGHTGWVCKLLFSRDGRRLISAATDQSIRFWDTSNWTETQVLHGHTDEVHAVAISEPAHLVASAGKDGNLMLWKEDGKSATDGYRRLPEDLGANQVLPLDHSRVLLLPPGKPPELIDLKRDSPSVSLPELGSSTNVLGWFGTNILCHWNGTNQILVRELRGAEFIQRGVIALDSGIRPNGFAYNPTRQLLAWTEGTSSNSVYVAGLAAPGRRIELKGDVPGLIPFRFSEDGNYLAAWTRGRDSLRVWNVDTGQNVASIGERVADATFAAGGRVLVVAIAQGGDHEIGFYDLAKPDRAPRRVPGRYPSWSLSVSPDGGLVASSTISGLVRLFDPAKGELIESVHGHLNAVFSIAFSPDGRRLISASGGREAVKLWDVGTRQELLTLAGTGSILGAARWSADGDVILVGAPWQAWRAPSWEEIAAAEAKEKSEIKQP